MGAAIAYGAAKSGSAVTLLDQGDVAYRASRGNFGLVWLQSKGAGFPATHAGAGMPSTIGARWPASSGS